MYILITGSDMTKNYISVNYNLSNAKIYEIYICNSI